MEEKIMIGIIVTGHGNFGSGLTSSVNLIAGEQECYRYVDFTAELDQLTDDLTKAMDDLKDCEGIIVFSDLAGGSPFKTAVEIGFPRGNVVVVAGTNLGMIVEISMSRKFITDLETLANMALSTGKDQVVRYEFKKPVVQESDDGI